MDQDETYAAWRDGACDIAQGLNSDGRIDTWDLTPLADPRNFFPIAKSVPAVRKAVLENTPEIADLLNRLSVLLDDDAMRELTLKIAAGADGIAASGDEASVEEAALSFLREKRLLKLPTLAVGSENTTEQLILGKMVGLLLQMPAMASPIRRGWATPKRCARRWRRVVSIPMSHTQPKP